jgi:hypothetical protein
MSEETKTQVPPTEQEANKTYLLSTISYSNRADYEKFLENLTPEHSLIVLISGVNHAQIKGAYNLDEAELIARAIRRLTPNQDAQTEEPQTTQPTTEEPAPKAKKSTKKQNNEYSNRW